MTTVVIQSRPTIVEVATPGVQGLPGAAGSGAGVTEGIEAAFAFGDASPNTVYTLPDARVIVRARIVIDTPFDGAGAALALGTAGAPDALIAAADNDPANAATYETSPNLQLATGSVVRIAITPGAGATQGAGRIFLDAYEVTP